ncbi:hypothetical protein GCM10022234_25350 [Aeromicrobium panaciterrae]|uniref:hypothetical protein n=1 Tax=Aeromicrobium panaciterrae TaxID=363861 RepID=UPI0031D77717
MYDDGFPSDSTFSTIFTLAAIAIALGFAFTIFVAIRNFMAAKKAGYDPFTLQTDLTTTAMKSGMMSPSKSMEARLAEVDGLHERGVISDAEHAAARAAILKG